MSATSSFTEDMWKRHFCVEFEGEAGIGTAPSLSLSLLAIAYWYCVCVHHVLSLSPLGIDIGGVSREFINCLCDIMFSGRNPRGLFKGFKQDDMQSLVRKNMHTNQRKTKYS